MGVLDCLSCSSVQVAPSQNGPPDPVKAAQAGCAPRHAAPPKFVAGPAIPSLSKDGNQVVLGPYLAFHDYSPATQQWRGSVLLVTRSDVCPSSPTLHVRAPDVGEASVQGVQLEAFNGWTFWRFDVMVACGASERAVEYWLTAPGQDETGQPSPHYTFFVPGAAQPWHWGFYSCNGFHDPANEVEAGGINPLWKDVLAQHEQEPMHLVIGGGDQLYNDPVWNCPSLDAWCKNKDYPDRWKDPFTAQMSTEVNNFFFNNYFKQWTQPSFRQAMATIPQAMTWDDHDTFDGWGSYPDYLHNCPVFQGVFAASKHFYALFQQHATPDDGPVRLNGAFGARGCWNTVTCLGPTLALVMLDCRMERTQKQVITHESYAQVQAKLMALPDTVRHVVIIASIPLIYPEIPDSEEVFGGLSHTWFGGAFSVAHLLQKTGLAEGLICQFGTVDLLDDVQDHWSSRLRMGEKATLVRLMQHVASVRGFRFQLLGGDVHLACVGRFASKSHPPLEQDYRFMPNLVSSAMANVPPPAALVKILSVVDSRIDVDVATEEYMVKDVFGGEMLMPHRNWLMAREQPRRAGGDDSIYYQFRVEKDAYGTGMRAGPFQLSVPALPGAPKDPSAPELPFAGVQPPQIFFSAKAAILA